MAPSSKDDDSRAFTEAMRGARPLGGRRVAANEIETPAVRAPARPVAKPLAAATFEVEESNESISGRRRDVGADVVRRLRAGADRIEARLDLHGRREDEAVRELERFVVAARSRGQRVVLVIHGRGLNSDPGGPVLRPAVWAWLKGERAAHAAVMAFVTARPREGGAGATVLRLGR